jgi:hypothetical protein
MRPVRPSEALWTPPDSETIPAACSAIAENSLSCRTGRCEEDSGDIQVQFSVKAILPLFIRFVKSMVLGGEKSGPNSPDTFQKQICHADI